jgi:aminoglycoside phosphotransferase (APT) family kinase protein
MTVDQIERLAPLLQTHLQSLLGVKAQICALSPMADGHAGLTYGFELQSPDKAPEAFILKLAPRGVRRSGSTDVFRQAKLLRSLHAAGYPAPAVPWACSGDEPLGAPFVIMDRLPGRTFIIWDPAPSLVRAPQRMPAMWVETAQAMAKLHRFDWDKVLADWEAPVTLAGELDRWSDLLRHTQDDDWLDLALPLLAALRRSTPTPPAPGLVHGDFQPGNVLFHEGRLTGVIDWDLAAIAPQGIDVGWLLMMADPECWAEGWKPFAPAPRSDLLDAYWNAGGPERAHLGWFQAFAHFRLGAIAGLNLKLHRNGRRHDPIWEKFAPSIPLLLRRGKDLL